MKHSRKGMTLIELILVIALIGIIGSIPISMYIFGLNTHATTVREFDIQSNIRLTSQKITNTIRNSSAIFLFPDEIDDASNKYAINQFKKDSYFSSGDESITLDTNFLNTHPGLKPAVDKLKGWSFVVLNESKTEVREFKWNITGSDYTVGYYTMTRIVKKQESPKLTYDIEYEKTNLLYDDGLIQFKLVVTVEGSGTPTTEIISELDSINSLQAIDKGKENGKVSTALFFRTDDRPLPNDKEAVIAMVLDESGSMEEAMKTADTAVVGVNRRIDILKTQTKEMITSFSNLGLGKTNINIIPFSNSANIKDSNDTSYSEFLDVSNPDNLKAINGAGSTKGVIDNMKPAGGTNVGDGIRRAYHRMRLYNEIPSTGNKDKNKYIIILMDGVPSFGSVHSPNGFYKSNNELDQSFLDGNNEFNKKFRFHSYDKEWWSGNIKAYNYKAIDGKPLFVLKDGALDYNTRSGVGLPLGDNEYSQLGGLYGTGYYTTASNVVKGKEYIEQVSGLLPNIQNSSGVKNLKVFLIGFSGDASNLTELTAVENLINNNNNGNGVPTKQWIAKDGESLEGVLNEIRQIIVNETWHIDGPDWSVISP